MDVPAFDKDGNKIRLFRAGVSGLDQETGAEILKNKERYIGRMVTTKYFGRSVYGVPRFGKVKEILD